MPLRTSPFRHVPNTITCLNLLCGCLSIISSTNGQLDTAAYFILAAAVFDFLDGFAARWLKAYSAIGKELDSLADAVSFGVAPSFIMYILLLPAIARHGFPIEIFTCGWLIAISAFLIAVFSALRLAKFNVDSRQTDSFIGLPTPANAIFICSLAFRHCQQLRSLTGRDDLSESMIPLQGNMFFLLGVTVVFSYLLVAEIPLFSLKFKSFDWKNNKTRYIFIALSAILLMILHWAGLAAVILLYIILSILTNILCIRKI